MNKTLTIQLDGNRTADVQIEDRVFPDRTCGQYESGWRTYDLNTDTEYFLSDTGEVWIQPENRVVGVCPFLKEEYEKFEAIMEECIDD